MTEKNISRGRPPLATSEKRSAKLEIRLTDAEKKAIAAKSKRAGLSLSDWARKILIESGE